MRSARAALPFPAPAPAVQSGLAEFAADVRAGLRGAQKSLPAKYLYDALGSALFEAITELPEYGVTRAEERVLRRHAAEMIEVLPCGLTVAELGAGSGRKTLPVLEAILARQASVSYAAIDLSASEHERLTRRFATRSRIRSRTIRASYLEGLRAAATARPAREPLLVMFLGSTLGNLDAWEQLGLGGVRAQLHPGDALLLGTDLVKPVPILLAAYDDSLGVTAAFERNVLARINRELGGDFDLRAFGYEASWSEPKRRIEMHLRSLAQQIVHIPGASCRVTLREGETIRTEWSHKFRAADLPGFAASAGFTAAGLWSDEAWPFADSLWLA